MKSWSRAKWALSRENLSSGFYEIMIKGKMSLVRRKPVFGVFTRYDQPACSTTGTSWRLEILAIKTRGIILSRKWTTKVLIRLCGCVGWSAPLLFAYGKNRFSHDMAPLIYCKKQTNRKVEIKTNNATKKLLFLIFCLYSVADHCHLHPLQANSIIKWAASWKNLSSWFSTR